jgi:hypothetical protein
MGKRLGKCGRNEEDGERKGRQRGNRATHISSIVSSKIGYVIFVTSIYIFPI